MATDLYFGPDNDSAGSPPSPVWLNPAIEPPATFNEGTGTTINVKLQNHGADDALNVNLELYWSDPTTGFAAVGSQNIGHDFINVPGVDVTGPTDGLTSYPFSWTPPHAAATTNGGHVCLLARCDGYSSSPTTDRKSAIHNIHVYGPAPAPKMRMKMMAFAFAATNTLKDSKDTKLTVRALDPQKDRQKLELIVANPHVNRQLERRQVKFATAKHVLVGAGREALILKPDARARPEKDPHHIGVCHGPRLSRTGPITEDQLRHVLSPHSKFDAVQGPLDLELVPGEMRQMVAGVVLDPDAQNVVYAVEVCHENPKRVIGGLTILFVPPHNYF